MKSKTLFLSGFSLIELMISLAIVTIIIALTCASSSFLHDMLVHNELDKLYAIAHYLQKKAQLTNSEQTLQFDRLGKKYSFNGHTELLPAGIEFGVLPGIKGPPSAPVSLIHSPITFSGEKIIFYPQGIMQSGTLYLMNAQRGCMYALSCGVAHVSFLRKYRYDKRWVLMG